MFHEKMQQHPRRKRLSTPELSRKMIDDFASQIKGRHISSPSSRKRQTKTRLVLLFVKYCCFMHTTCLLLSGHWFQQNAENVPVQVAPAVASILPHHDHHLPLDQATHRHVLHLQLILTAAADLQADHLTPDLYLLAGQVHIHDLRSHLLAVHLQSVPSQGLRKQE